MKPSDTYQALEHALSKARFARYLDWADGDHSNAIHLYTLNTRLSETLYTPLQMLEVTLRNRVHDVMTELHQEDWFRDEAIVTNTVQRQQLQKAFKDIAQHRKPATSGRVVAELTFSFWTSMVGTEYDQLWQQGLYKVAKKPNGKGVSRKNIAAPLAPIRNLRNRIAHHEPIIMWNLPKHYENLMQILIWLSPVAATWCEQTSQFRMAYPEEGITLIK